MIETEYDFVSDYKNIILEIESSRQASYDSCDISLFENTVEKYKLDICPEDAARYYKMRDDMLLSGDIGMNVHDLFNDAIDAVIKYGHMFYLTECIDRYQHLLSYDEANKHIETWNDLNTKLTEEQIELRELVEQIDKEQLQEDELKLLYHIEAMSIE